MLQGEFFSLFEITDKGSSWMGPIAVGLIQQVTGSIRYGIFYVLIMLTVPLALLWRVDEEVGMHEAAHHAAVNREEDRRDLGQPDSPAAGSTAVAAASPSPVATKALLPAQQRPKGGKEQEGAELVARRSLAQ